MDKTDRKKIGIILNYPKNWLGGIYYLINIINSLEHVNEDRKPYIYLFYHPSLIEFTSNITYPNIEKIPWKFTSQAKGYINSVLSGKNCFDSSIGSHYELDGLYPINDFPIRFKAKSSKISKVVSWIPDLQHKFYPQFFDKKRRIIRDEKIKLLLKNGTDLVVSSEDVASHFRKFFEIPKSLKIHVVRFVSSIDIDPNIKFNDLIKKYNIPENYFMISNQHLEHKNLLALLKAFAKLKVRNNKKHLVVTGKDKFNNIDNSAYMHKINEVLEKNQLQEYVKILGVIPRAEQICLMQNCEAVIQPSLFEGWSTLIEDAKTLQKPVIASNIPVHYEQLGDKAQYFNPNDEDNMADVIANYKINIKQPLYEPLEKRIADFANSFLNIFG
ncbi:MAG: glycosyltransferase [Bacteroidetes bacterium]|nr:glycosyltransferase [Bacteroidota bacterium]